MEGKEHGSENHNQNTIGAGGVNPLQNLRQSFKCLICSWLFQLLQAVILGVEWSNAGPRRNPTNLACYSTHNHHLSSSLSSSSSLGIALKKNVAPKYFARKLLCSREQRGALQHQIQFMLHLLGPRLAPNCPPSSCIHHTRCSVYVECNALSASSRVQDAL